MSDFRHWSLSPGDADTPAILTLAVADHPANALHKEVLDELDALLEVLEREAACGLVLQGGPGQAFSVGADVREFAHVPDAPAAHAMLRRGQELFARISRLPYPTVAVLRGHCMGGGLELALACDYRVANDAPGVRIGLPEVRLGIHPGYGGAVRLPRLIGDLPALRMMLSGRTVDGRAARRMGLVDAAVPERCLDAAARGLLRAGPPAHRPGRLLRVPYLSLPRAAVSRFVRRGLRRRVRQEHYPAPYGLLDFWKNMNRNPDAALLQEAESVADLFQTPAARHLVRLFLLRAQLRRTAPTLAPFHRVHVIGSGAMGGDIAAWCALRGLQVTVQDLDAQRIAPLYARAEKIFARERSRARDARDRLVADPAGLGVADADVVIEAVIEDRAVKQAIYHDIEPRLKDGALLATNTSSLCLAELSEGMREPLRLIGLHFFNPVPRMPLVEVIHAGPVQAADVARARAFARHIGKVPLAVRSAPGFLVNRVLLPYLMEAVRMHEEGVAATHIDEVAKTYGMPMGPLELADMVGLDICLAAGSVLADSYGVELPARLHDLVGKGHLGRKSGRGFYSWKNGRIRRRRARGRTAGGDVGARLEASLVREAVHCLHEGLVDSADEVDAGVVLGCGFAPHRGGPLAVVRDAGVDRVRNRLEVLAAQYGDRFAPGPGWDAAELRTPWKT